MAESNRESWRPLGMFIAYLVTCIEAVTSEKASIDVKECELSDNEETETTEPGVHSFNLGGKLFVG